MTVTITPHALTDASAAALWSAFAAAIGAEQLLACYGWPQAPTALRPGELAWGYRDLDDRLVAWGSVIRDPTTATYWHTSGVFPAFARQGYRQAIRRHLCREAFARGAEAVTLVVLDTNCAHRDRCYREAELGSPWQPSGRIWRPAPGQTLFTLLRADAELVTGIRRECADLHGLTQGGPHGA